MFISLNGVNVVNLSQIFMEYIAFKMWYEFFLPLMHKVISTCRRYEKINISIFKVLLQTKLSVFILDKLKYALEFKGNLREIFPGTGI